MRYDSKTTDEELRQIARIIRKNNHPNAQLIYMQLDPATKDEPDLAIIYFSLLDKKPWRVDRIRLDRLATHMRELSWHVDTDASGRTVYRPGHPKFPKCK